MMFLPMMFFRKWRVADKSTYKYTYTDTYNENHKGTHKDPFGRTDLQCADPDPWGPRGYPVPPGIPRDTLVSMGYPWPPWGSHGGCLAREMSWSHGGHLGPMGPIGPMGPMGPRAHGYPIKMLYDALGCRNTIGT